MKPVTMMGASLMAAASVMVGAAYQPQRPAPAKIQVADGIFLFQTAPYGDVGLDGNSVAILSDEGVLVFDSNGTPSAAAAVLAEIKTLTDKPVKYLVNSHWHWDHWYGAEIYARAFPDLRIITHENTRRMMMGPALEFNRPGLQTQLPGFIARLEQRVARAEAAAPTPANLPRLKQALDDARFFLDQKKNTTHTLANLTFTTDLTLYMGKREIRVLNYGRAVTPGDAFLYLPRERILITGDLLVNPISFALSSYPTEWLNALERIDALDASVIVPGHGDPLNDKALLHATMAVFRELLRQGKESKDKGMDVDAAREAILPSLARYQATITKGNAALEGAFTIQLVDWYLHRVYEELNGPLTDAIAAIPQK
jgi:glyoxylase-like metal-dependent hydrolase (beta-lactamase superfamily II)